VSADADYIRGSFRTLGVLCAERGLGVEAVRSLIDRGLVPEASYRLPDGDYFAPDLLLLLAEVGEPGAVRGRFEERYAVASDATGALAGPDELDEAWEAYIAGDWGRLLVEATPESAVRANRLARAVAELLADPAPEDARWASRLEARVGALARLLREGCGADRTAEDPHPWDRWVRQPQERYPDIVQVVPTASDGRGDPE
jgi:hypothetical protein